jgi:sugar/nucleoside kinase (ribokinase family)
MSEKPVLVIGDACVDLVVPVPQKGGNDRQHPPPELYGGGTGGNTAVALARLDVPTAFMGTIGDDGYGRFAVDTLEAEGIDTTYVTTCPDAFTAQVLALIDSQGERTLFGWPHRGGAHIYLAPEAVEPDIIRQMGWVHTSGMCLVESPIREAILRAMELAQAAGIPVSLDLNLRLGFEEGQLPQPFLDTIRQAIARSDYVFGSATDEITYLTPGTSFEAGARLLAAGERAMIIRRGSEGAWVLSPQGVATPVPAFRVDVADTLGAGDVFNAGFIAACRAGRPLPAAVCWGNAVAALKIGRPGARSSPTRREVEGFLSKSATGLCI